MTVPVWPSSLPSSMNREGFAHQRGDGRLRSQTDVGPGKTRRRFTAVARPLVGTMWMTRVQLQRFDDWWDVDTKGGSLPFMFPATGKHGFPMRSDDGSLLLSGDGRPLLISAWWLVMFSTQSDPPQASSLSDELWPVTLNLEILP